MNINLAVRQDAKTVRWRCHFATPGAGHEVGSSQSGGMGGPYNRTSRVRRSLPARFRCGAFGLQPVSKWLRIGRFTTFSQSTGRPATRGLIS
jgi:hypothetical protein